MKSKINTISYTLKNQVLVDWKSKYVEFGESDERRLPGDPENKLYGSALEA